MSDIEKQEAEPPMPETADPTEPEAAYDPEQTPANGSGRIAWIALLLVLGVAVAVYMQWSALEQKSQTLAAVKQQQQATKERLDALDKTIATQQTVLAKQKETLKRERDQLRQQAADMQASMDRTFASIDGDNTQWIVAEAEYLMRIANYRLQLERDSATALVALERADQRLQASGDPVWNPVRKQLAAEMAGLKALKQLDLAGQALKLSGLLSQIENLKLPNSIPEAPVQPKQEQASEPGFSLDRVGNDMWEGFKSLVVIRHHDRPVSAMLEPNQRFFLYHNLRLQLETARLALLRRDKPLFVSSLERAEQWIREFFDPQQVVTKGMLEEIGALKGLELVASTPDISGSLRLLRKRQGQAGVEPQAGVGSTKPALVVTGQTQGEVPQKTQNTANPEQTPGQRRPDTKKRETP